MTMEEKYGYEIDKGNLVSIDRRLTLFHYILYK